MKTEINKTFEEFYGKHFKHMIDVMNSACIFAKRMAEIAGDSKAKIVSRIKTPESMTNKIKKDGFELNDNSIFVKEGDAIGVRIITDTINDVYNILESMMKSIPDNDILVIKDYIKNPKNSGYRSIHIIINFNSDDVEYPKMKVEFQIRTAIMDCWASLEHLVKYKQVVDLTPEMYDLLNTYRSEVNKQIAECHKKKCIERG